MELVMSVVQPTPGQNEDIPEDQRASPTGGDDAPLALRRLDSMPSYRMASFLSALPRPTAELPSFSSGVCTVAALTIRPQLAIPVPSRASGVKLNVLVPGG